MVETRLTLRGLSDEQRILAQVHWYTFLALQTWEADGRSAMGRGHAEQWLMVLERRMQPETLHRLARARIRYSLMAHD